MLKASMFSCLQAKGSVDPTVKAREELLARQAKRSANFQTQMEARQTQRAKRSADFQIALDARRTNRIALAIAEAIRNDFLNLVLENQELAHTPRVQEELKFWNERINQLKLSLR